MCSYVSADGVTYLAICEKAYDQALAFAYLNEVKTAFGEELKSVFGTQGVDYRSKVETVEKAEVFARFGISSSRLCRKRNSQEGGPLPGSESHEQSPESQPGTSRRRQNPRRRLRNDDGPR